MNATEQSAGRSVQMRMGRILVPIDFSEHSKDALRYAVDLGKQFDAELILTFVIESVGYPADLGYGQVAIPAIERDLADRGRTELQRLADQYIGTRLKFRIHVPTGRPFVEIIKSAREFGSEP